MLDDIKEEIEKFINTVKDTAQDTVNTINEVRGKVEEIGDKIGDLGENVKNEVAGKFNEIKGEVDNKINEAKEKIGEVKNNIENKVEEIKTSFEDSKIKLEEIAKFPQKVNLFIDRVEYCVDHGKGILFLVGLFAILARYLYKSLIGIIDGPYNFVSDRLGNGNCEKCARGIGNFNPFDHRKMCKPCRTRFDKKLEN